MDSYNLFALLSLKRIAYHKFNSSFYVNLKVLVIISFWFSVFLSVLLTVVLVFENQPL